jgi:nucleoid-associated protein YgaU
MPPAAVRTGRAGDLPPLGAAPADDDAPSPTVPNRDPEAAPDPDPTPVAPSRGGPSRASDVPSAPDPAAPPTTGPDGAADPDPAAGPPTAVVPTAHVVEAGDNLWEIAAAHLAATTGRSRADLGALEIAPYWTQVCIANRPRLTSGDVSLIYAGEVIELPSI